MGLTLAAAAPLIGKLLPVAAKGVVRLVERIKGHGNGPTEKKPMADGLLAALFGLLENAVPGLGLPQGDEVGQLVQSAWEALNKAGKLKGPDTSLDDDEVPADAPFSKTTLVLCATLMEREAANMRKAAEHAMD